MLDYTIQDLEDNINYLNETKNQIKSALINKGLNISNSDTFRSYANKINSLDTSVQGKALWYVHDISSTVNIDYTDITNIQNTFNLGFSGVKTNILTPGNYYANQKTTPEIGDLALINNITCINTSNSNQSTSVYAFGVFSDITLDDSNIIAETSIYGGYLL